MHQFLQKVAVSMQANTIGFGQLIILILTGAVGAAVLTSYSTLLMQNISERRKQLDELRSSLQHFLNALQGCLIYEQEIVMHYNDLFKALKNREQPPDPPRENPGKPTIEEYSASLFEQRENCILQIDDRRIGESLDDIVEHFSLLTTYHHEFQQSDRTAERHLELVSKLQDHMKGARSKRADLIRQYHMVYEEHTLRAYFSPRILFKKFTSRNSYLHHAK